MAGCCTVAVQRVLTRLEDSSTGRSPGSGVVWRNCPKKETGVGDGIPPSSLSSQRAVSHPARLGLWLARRETRTLTGQPGRLCTGLSTGPVGSNKHGNLTLPLASPSCPRISKCFRNIRALKSPRRSLSIIDTIRSGRDGNRTQIFGLLPLL